MQETQPPSGDAEVNRVPDVDDPPAVPPPDEPPPDARDRDRWERL